MICPNCSRPDMRVEKQVDRVDTMRWLSCPCGEKVVSSERVVFVSAHGKKTKGRPLAAVGENGKAPRAPHPKTREVIAKFCEAWSAARAGAKYQVAKSDAGQVSGMLATMTEEAVADLPRAFAAYVADPDEFLARQGHTLAYFCAKGLYNRYATNGARNGTARRNLAVGHASPSPRESLAVVGKMEIKR